MVAGVVDLVCVGDARQLIPLPTSVASRFRRLSELPQQRRTVPPAERPLESRRHSSREQTLVFEGLRHNLLQCRLAAARDR